ncbi:alanine racemase [Candidatus Poribacteria bacterium]|nr:alanine racemase [Candidatus Poribacteria bacterium]
MNKLDLDTSAAVIDLDIMEQNINSMGEFAKSYGVTLRPHVKTHKIPEIAQKQIQAGAKGITCAKLSEAQVMIEKADIHDIFVANVIFGQEKLDKLLELSQKSDISVGVDSFEVAEPISQKAVQHGTRIPVILKIDVGLNRLGVLPGEFALDIVRKLSNMKGLIFRGIYTHEGHVYGAENFEEVRQIGLKAGKVMVETAQLLRDNNIETEVVSVGATPSAKVTCTVPGITETRPGTYVFNDNYQIKLGVAKESQCAMSVLATVISVPAPDRAIIDAGTKSFFSDKSSDFGVYGLVKGKPHLHLIRAYEEHGVFSVKPDGRKPEVGDKVEIIPNHVCPVVNLFDYVTGVRNDIVETRWEVAARGKLT